MNENKKIIALLIKNGYMHQAYGYKKVVDDGNIETIHWLTLFEKRLQMYAHMDGIDEKEYDTGHISPTVDELEILIKLLANK